VNERKKEDAERRKQGLKGNRKRGRNKRSSLKYHKDKTKTAKRKARSVDVLGGRGMEAYKLPSEGNQIDAEMAVAAEGASSSEDGKICQRF